MAKYSKALQKPITVNKGRKKMTNPVRVNLHVAVAEAATLHGYFNQSGTPDSHFYIRRDGSVEQYVDTSMQAFADLQGNTDSISIETQGGVAKPDQEPWTSPQIESIAQILVWAHKTHGIPLRLATTSKADSTSHGVSWHRLGVPATKAQAASGVSQTGGRLYSRAVGKICPGQGKINQIPGILEKAKNLISNNEEFSEEDMKELEEIKSDLNKIKSAIERGERRDEQIIALLTEADLTGARKRAEQTNAAVGRMEKNSK